MGFLLNHAPHSGSVSKWRLADFPFPWDQGIYLRILQLPSPSVALAPVAGVVGNLTRWLLPLTASLRW